MAIIADDAIRVYDDKKKTKKTRDEMRCKRCNGVIIYTPAYGHYPERWHCSNCGRGIDEETGSSIVENLEVDKPRKRRYTKRKDTTGQHSLSKN